MDALEPGEKVVWSDRPHVGFWFGFSLRTPLSLFALSCLYGTWFMVLLVTVLVLLENPHWTDPLGRQGLAGRIPIAVVSLFGIIEFWWRFSTFDRFRSMLYAVTDRGHVVFVEQGAARALPLPPPEAITTTARGTQEFGDIDLGLGPVLVIRHVSYPLIALESIRAAARKDSSS
jgi:hypothetical protein